MTRIRVAAAAAVSACALSACASANPGSAGQESQQPRRTASTTPPGAATPRMAGRTWATSLFTGRLDQAATVACPSKHPPIRVGSFDGPYRVSQSVRRLSSRRWATRVTFSSRDDSLETQFDLKVVRLGTRFFVC